MGTRERESLACRWREFAQLPTLTEHWYWRPGWAPGRSFYTWHLTFDSQPALHQLVRRIQAGLNVPGLGLDLVPREGLHLTMQGLGFTDEVGAGDVDAIVEQVAVRCASIPPVRISLGPVDPDTEGVGLLVSPWAPVERVRTAVRDGIGAVWREVPEPADGFRPHVTVAYSGADVPAGPLREALAPLRLLPPVDVLVGEVQLIALSRDDRVYRWDVVAAVPLRG
jgi:2'-5' RNA ligase